MSALDRDEPVPLPRRTIPRLGAVAVPLFLLALAAAMLALGEYLAPGFATSTNVLQLLKIASFLGLVALGQTLVMLVGGIGGVPWMLIVWALIGTLAIVAIRYSRWGRRLLAVGENSRVSFLNGIANDRVVIGAYVICGLTASVTGILFAAFSGSSFLGMGDQFVLPAIAAVVLGGTSMFGGRGGYGGTFAAVIFTTLLSTVLVIGNISAGVRSIIFGLAILLALIAQRFLTRSGERD